MLRIATIASALVFLVGFTIELVLGLDWFAPRTTLRDYYVVRTQDRLDLSHLDDWNRAAKEKYAAGVQTSVTMTNGVTYWQARVDDAVVESRPLSGRLLDNANGIFMVIDRDGARVRFPFMIALGDRDRIGGPTRSDLIKNQLSGSEPDDVLRFDDSDWQQQGCRRLDAPIVGFPAINSILHLGRNDLCLVETVSTPRSVLVGVAKVGSGMWRAFGRRICRSLASSWMEAMARAQQAKAPDYVACILMTDPHDGQTSNAIAAHFFEVREDGSLALFAG